MRRVVVKDTNDRSEDRSKGMEKREEYERNEEEEGLGDEEGVTGGERKGRGRG